jgi:PAS domain S-box-containing protein
LRRGLAALLFAGYGLGAAAQDLIPPRVTTVASATPGEISMVELTHEEQAWLSLHPVIRVAFGSSYAPLEQVGANGHSGISMEYLTLVADRLGITFEIADGLTWQESLRRLMAWELDASMCLASTVERNQFLNFTKPYLTLSYVIVAKMDIRYPGGLEELKNKNVAICQGNAAMEWIQRDYPSIKLLPVQDISTGIQLISKGEADAFVDNIWVIHSFLSNASYPELHIAGQTEYVGEFCAAVRKDWPLFLTILQKSLDTISEQERSAIHRKWEIGKSPEKFDYALFLQLLGAFIVILAAVLFWNRKLAFEIALRKNAEAHTEHLKLAIEQTTEAVVITDKDGAILYVNPAFLRMTGFSRREVIGAIMRPLQLDDGGNVLAPEMWKILLSGKTWEGQFKNIRKDGSPFTELVSISPVRNRDREIIHFVAIRKDISKELQDAAEKENLRSQLLQSNKMESIGRLAGGIAHDFNNMLQAILGYAEMAIEQVTPEMPIFEDIQSIQNAARRSTNLTRQLLIFARKQSGSYKIIALNQTVYKMLDILRRLIGDEIEFTWNPGADVPSIYMDPSQLDQVLTNLCINARDAIQGKGKIDISTTSTLVETPLQTALGELPPGLYTLLSVSDNGCGMSKEVIAQIFEPFFTTKTASKGTGLGLATVYGIVKQCEGGIVVRSEEGKGTVFDILLPAHADEKETPAVGGTDAASAPAPQLPLGNETILLVDDEETILHAAKRMLESLGYRVLFTSDSEEAVQLARQHKDEIKLLISDVIMPKMNGPEMVKKILGENPELPYLYMSGYTANLLLEQGFCEVPKCLAKPFTRQTLAYKVRECLIPN